MKKPLTDQHGVVRELTGNDFKAMQDPESVLPDELLDVLPRRGRPKSANPKKQLTIRLSPEVVDFFKSKGKGWQTKINDVLLEHVHSQKTS